MVNHVVPTRFLTKSDRLDGLVNPDYKAWEVQDQTLLDWLQSTLSKSVLSRVLGCTHSYKFGQRFMSISTSKPSLVPDNYVHL